jgi:hypothetical protein
VVDSLYCSQYLFDTLIDFPQSFNNLSNILQLCSRIDKVKNMGNVCPLTPAPDK